MGIKLKALGLGLLAAFVVGGTSVVSAPADSGGVMHSDVEWTHLKGAQEGSWEANVLHDFSWEETYTCEVAKFTASISGKTATEVTVAPELEGCEDQNWWPLNLNMNGCTFVVTFTDQSAAKHHTAHMECPAGKEAVNTLDPPIVGECLTSFPPQTPTTGGVTYKTIEVSGKHAITAEVAVEGITSTRTDVGFGCSEGSGHDNEMDLTATIKVEGFNTNAEPTNVTVTTASS
jgi:hypothetical protein